MTPLQAASIAVLTLSTALPAILRAQSQSQTVTDAAAAIQTFVVPTSAGAAYEVVPADGVRVVGAASGRATGGTLAVALAVPAGWPSGRRTAGFLVTGADSVALTVNVPERRSFMVISADAVIRRDRDSVTIGIRNSGNVALRVAADPVAHGGWRYGGGAWPVPAGQTVFLSLVFRGRAEVASPSLSVVFRAEGTPTKVVPVRVEEGQGIVFPMAVGLGWTHGRPFLAVEGAGQIVEGLRIDAAVSLGALPAARQLWSTAHRNYLSVQLPRFTAAIGEIPARSAEGLVWVPLGLGWALRAGGLEARTVEVALGWRDDFPRPAGGFSWHLRMADRFAGETRLAGSLFRIGGSTLLGFGDGLYGGAFRVSRATRAPWSISMGAARVHDGVIPIGSFDGRRELGGAAVAVWGRRDMSSDGGWAAVTSAGYGVEVKGHAGTRLLANGFLFHNERAGAGPGARGTAFTAALRSRAGARVGGGISGGASAGSGGRRLSAEASGAWRATRRLQAEAFYRVDDAAESAWSGGVRVRLSGAGATGIVGIDYARRSGDQYEGPRLFADLTGRTGDRLRWNLRTNAAGGRGGLVHFDADLAAAFRLNEGASVFGAVHRNSGEAGGTLSFGLRKAIDIGLPAAAQRVLPAAEANGSLEVTVRFRGDAGADAPHGAVSLAGPAGSIELPLDRGGRAVAVGLPAGLYTVVHLPPANEGVRLAAIVERVVVARGGRAEVVIAAGYQRRAVRINDLGGP